MATYYAALGRFESLRQPYPEIVPDILMAGNRYGLTMAEFLLWSCLNNQILNQEELRQEYLRLARMASKLAAKFDESLDRLILRGLVVKAESENDLEALFELVAGRFVKPIPFSRKLADAVYYLKHGQLKLWQAVFYLLPPSMDALEKRVWKLLKQQSLSGAEVARCLDLGVQDVSDANLMQNLYSIGDGVTCETIRQYGQASVYKGQAVLAVANLMGYRMVSLEEIEVN